MTMLRGDCSSFLLRQPGSHFFSSITSNGNRKNTYWKPPQAAERLDSHLPMSSSVIQNRASMEDLRSLRFATAVKTPYLPNGRFDLETYDNLVNMQISNGVEGILVAGTTGEGYLMTWDDQISLIAHTVQSFGDKVQVIGNSGSNCTSEAIKATERGFAAGMDVSLQINPYSGKTSTDGLVAHYNSVLSIGPVIIYNVPTRTSSDIPPSVIEILAQNPNLVGVKECVGNDRVKKYTNEGLVVWTGNDEESHEARWECGATGVHSVAGNLVPGLIRKLMFEAGIVIVTVSLITFFVHCPLLTPPPYPTLQSGRIAMAALKASSFLLRRPALPFFRSITTNINRRNTYWKPPQAAERLDFHHPISSSVIQNRASIEDVRSLRLMTAVKTPYLPNGRFDLETYDNLVNMQIANGIKAVLVAGSTGEGQLMTWDDQIMLIEHTVNCFGDKVKVIGNAGSNCTSEAINATERGFTAGMDAALHISPYYGKTSLDGLVAHYNAVLSIGPVIIYNIPQRTTQDIPPSIIETLAQNPNLVGVKECAGNDRIKQYTDKGLVVWTGIDKESHDARWDCGAVGVQSVAANLIPGLIRELMFEGKNPTLNSKLKPLFEWISQEPVPIALNTALAQLGVIKPVFRLPHVPLRMEKRANFVKLVKEIGREHFVGEKDVQVLDDDDFTIVARY